MKRKDLKAYAMSDLHGFNEMSTRLWGYITLSVTFGKEMDERTVESPLLVIQVVSIYNCIMGCPTLAVLKAVTSTVHLKMKYHNNNGDVATIYPDLKAVERCHWARGKLHAPQSASIVEGVGENLWCPVPSCSNADFDARREQKCPKGKKEQEIPFPSRYSLHQQAIPHKRKATDLVDSTREKGIQPLETKLLSERPTPDREFKSVQLDDNPTKKVKIGANLPPTVEIDLIEYLRVKANLFACSPKEMS